MKGAQDRKDRIEVRSLRRGKERVGFIDRCIRFGTGKKLVVTYGGTIYEVKLDGEQYYIEI